MSTSTRKKIGQRPEKEQVNVSNALHDTWRIMKPLVHFSVKAIKILAYTLIFIVKHIPKPEEHQPKGKNNKVVKI
jgi:hypothetical protein